MLKKVLITTGLLFAICFASVFWFFSLFSGQVDIEQLPATLPGHLHYVANAMAPSRGRILIVVTSQAQFPDTGKPTGYELTELSRAYYVFTANGFAVDVASPKGGFAPMVLDDDDMGPYDYAFLNDEQAKPKFQHTLPLAQVEPRDYRAVYFAGGKGTMFDFPDNSHIAALLEYQFAHGGVIAGVCHGPAALLNSTSLAGRTLTSFTNAEELFLIPDAQQRFSFLLEDALREKGAHYVAGPDYLHNVITDGKLVTGQNPWSVWSVAEQTIQALGYTPVTRAITPEEQAVTLLELLQTEGQDAAREWLANQSTAPKRSLIAMHFILSLMKSDYSHAWQQLTLLAHAKNVAS